MNPLTGDGIPDRRSFSPRFTTIEGVGDAQILGGREFAMRVWLDPIQLAARNVRRTTC